jgi:hypothetical protein
MNCQIKTVQFTIDVYSYFTHMKITCHWISTNLPSTAEPVRADNPCYRPLKFLYPWQQACSISFTAQNCTNLYFAPSEPRVGASNSSFTD